MQRKLQNILFGDLEMKLRPFDTLLIFLEKPAVYSEKAAQYLHTNIRLNRLESVVGGYYEELADPDKPLSLWDLLKDLALIVPDNLDKLITRLQFVIAPIAECHRNFHYLCKRMFVKH